MRILLLMGTSSVGKSLLTETLTDEGFKGIRNADEILKDYLDKAFSLKVTEAGLWASLTPEMTHQEVYRFAMRGQLNMNRTGFRKLVDVAVSPENTKQEVYERLQAAGVDGVRSEEMATALVAVKALFESDRNRPGPMECLDIGIDELLATTGNEDVLVIDLVPEATPSKTRDLLDAITARIQDYADARDIPVQFDKVMLYCQLDTLFENMRARNDAADKTGDQANKRVGINPVLQLASLVSAHPKEGPSMLRLSKRQLREIVEAYGPEDTTRREALFKQILGEGDSQYFYGFDLDAALPNAAEVAFGVHPALGNDWKIVENKRQDIRDIANEICADMGIEPRSKLSF